MRTPFFDFADLLPIITDDVDDPLDETSSWKILREKSGTSSLLAGLFLAKNSSADKVHSYNGEPW
jgi:hypothetical protein